MMPVRPTNRSPRHATTRQLRRTWPALALLCVTTLLAACGGSGGGPGGESADSSQPAEPPSSAASSSGSSASADAFPATVTTAFGDVTVESEPQRVVALGWGDAETALELGVQPVGAADWLGYGGTGVGPWLEGAYSQPPEILGTTEVDPEAVAALRPDLILDTRSDGTQERYDLLSQVAPTIGAPPDVGSFGTPWQAQLEMVGTALGRSDEAVEVREETTQALEEVASDHPSLDGATVAVGAFFDGGFGAYVDGDSRVELLEALGMRNKPEIDELADGGFFVDVSRERLDLLDADATVMFAIGGDASDFAGDELYRDIASVADDRDVVLDQPDIVNAFSSGTAPGVRFGADEVGPRVAEVLDGG